MNLDSDLPYIRSGSGLERANPVVSVKMGKYADLSGLSGPVNTSKIILPKADESVICRRIFNVGTNGSIWINEVGGVPGANQPGSIEIVSGGAYEIETREEIKCIGAVADIPYTAVER